MSFSKEQEKILTAQGWKILNADENYRFVRGNEWITISGNIINWSGRCKTYAPSPEDFAKWACEMPVYFDPLIKAKLNF